MKIGIVGTGFVGSAAAFALLMRGIGRELVLVDLNTKRAAAEAADLLHAEPFAHPMDIRAGNYADLAGAKVVIITAGVNQKPGETRLHLLQRNASVFKAVVPQILEHAPDTTLLVATNPVDIMTHLTAIYAEDFGVPSSRVLGTGTTLDTARLRALLGDHLGVDSHYVHAYVLGEHGDSEIVPWSIISIGGLTLDEFCHLQHMHFDDNSRTDIETSVRRAAYHIIEGKGATYYGIGSAIARIVKAILSGERAILTVCTRMPEAAGVTDVTLALPNLVGNGGILTTLPTSLTNDEKRALGKSAGIIRDAIDSIL